MTRGSNGGSNSTEPAGAGAAFDKTASERNQWAIRFRRRTAETRKFMAAEYDCMNRVTSALGRVKYETSEIPSKR